MEHTTYRCVDEVKVLLSNRALERDQDKSEKVRTQPRYANGILYKTSGEGKGIKLVVSGTELDRNMSQIIQGTRNAKTATFPCTVREVLDGAFSNTLLMSAILNEGVEVLGEYEILGCDGVFSNTRLTSITLPSTLRVLGRKTFEGCENLREVVFEEGSVLK